MFRYFPFTGDVADKLWVEKDLKPLCPDDEHTREKDLTCTRRLEMLQPDVACYR